MTTMFGRLRMRVAYFARKMSHSYPIRMYGIYYDRHPYVMAFATCAFKGCVADLICQTWVEGKTRKEVDILCFLYFSGT